MDKTEKSQDNEIKHNQPANANTVDSLITDLGNKEREVRTKARESIINMGESAAELLVKALSNPNERLRWEAEKLFDELEIDWHKHADVNIINSLIEDLGIKDGLARIRARNALVTIGKKAIPVLEKALDNKDELERWEVAKVLGQIDAPEATRALISALEDKSIDVHWVAADGLIAIGRPALAPLLHKLLEKPDSPELLDIIHYILHSIRGADIKEIIQPVLKALKGNEAILEVPIAAEAALESLRHQGI